MRIRYDEEGILWINPGTVSYDREQIEFLLPWLYYMREGDYPAEPINGYVGGKRSGPTTRAYYQAACDIAGEIDIRLSMTGLDRNLVEEAYCLDRVYEQLSLKYHLDIETIKQRINNSISYISSGECQRWVECSACYRFSTCRKKKKLKRTTIDYPEWCRRRNRRTERVSLKSTKNDIKT